MLIPKFPKEKQIFAIASKVAYIYNSNIKDKIHYINKILKNYGGYKIIQKYSDSRLITIQKDTVFIIAHRGTQISNTEDIHSDLNIAFTREFNDTFIDKRVSLTEKIIEDVKDKYDDAVIYLTGHSLGATSIYVSLLKSKYIYNSIIKAHLFNPGSSPLSYIKNIFFNTDDIKEKVHIYKIKGDLISDNYRTFQGKYYIYRLSESYLMNFTNFILNNSSIKMYNKLYGTLRYHSLDNFLN